MHLTARCQYAISLFMPKKTRKEKIIAELRRKLETAKISDEKVIVEKKESPRPIPNFQFPTSNIPTVATSFVLRDLKKTFLLAGLAISLELVVYWLTELGGSKFFKFLQLFKY